MKTSKGNSSREEGRMGYEISYANKKAIQHLQPLLRLLVSLSLSVFQLKEKIRNNYRIFSNEKLLGAKTSIFKTHKQ